MFNGGMVVNEKNISKKRTKKVKTNNIWCDFK